MKYSPRPTFPRILCLILISIIALGATKQLAQSNSEKAPNASGRTSATVATKATAAKEATAATAATKARLSHSYGSLPLSFEANRGQTAAQVKFLARSGGTSLFLTPGEAVLALGGRPRATSKEREAKRRGAAQTTQTTQTGRREAQSILRMRLAGARTEVRLSGLEELPGKSNYLIGSDPKSWRTDVPNYRKVRYEGVYAGVDLIFYGNPQQLEYDFVVAPGTDAGVIALDFSGAQRVRLDERGDLVFSTPAREVRQLKPQAYQQLADGRREIDCRYVLGRGGQISFALGAYDRSLPLVIDPVLSYSTYLGGSNQDESTAIAVDAQGSAYVTGFAASTNFPLTSGAYQTTFRGGSSYPPNDAFVTRLSPDGSTLLYSTYLGGTGGDVGTSIAVDAQGNAYVAGETRSTNFPVTAGAYKTTPAGGLDAFVSKLNPTGTALVYSTYLGGGNDEYNPHLALDYAGDVYVAGRTVSSDFPVTTGAFQRQYGGSGCFSSPCSDGFITKLTPAPGTPLRLSTYLGGSGDDFIDGLAVFKDGDQSIYVAGRTSSMNFPTTSGAFQPGKSGDAQSSDAFVTRLRRAGDHLVYSTYLGGAGEDYAYDLAVNAYGEAYVTGLTGSADFPVTPGVFQPSFGGGTGQSAFDAFVTKLEPSGRYLLYSTYLGGSDLDQGDSIAVNGAGEAFVAGETASRNLPVASNAFQPNFGGGLFDAFLSKLSPDGSQLAYGSYLGGSEWEQAKAIALDSNQNVYLTGSTYSYDFQTTPGAYQPYAPGSGDSFVARVDMNQLDYTVKGRVTNDYGDGLTDVEVILSGSVNRVLHTDADGYYKVGGLLPGSNVTLSAQRYGFFFDPQTIDFPSLSRNETADFSGAAPPIISGRITDTNGNGLSVPVNLSGWISNSTFSDYNGYYRFLGVPSGGDYTVTPLAPPLMSMSPPSRSVNGIHADQTLNFTVIPPPRITGRVTDELGNGMYAGVTLTGATSGTPIQQINTGYDGSYSFYALQRGETYTVTPQDLMAGRAFNPPSRTVVNLQEDQTLDFAALPMVGISGQVLDENGNPASDVQVALTGSRQNFTVTDYAGRYGFYALPRGGDYTVSVSRPATLYTYTPASRSTANLQENQSFNFTQLRPLMLTGQITDQNGLGLQATVTLTGTETRTTQADSNGHYFFGALPRGGSYTVTPSYPLYTFAPASQSITDAQSDTFFNFSALPPLRLSGDIVDETGVGLSGVNVTLSGTINAVRQTDANGHYFFIELPRGGNYSVTASSSLYNLTPPVQTFDNMSGDGFANFSAGLKLFQIAGRVADAGGAGLGGVTLTLGGGQTGTTQTDATGNYAFPNLIATRTYTVNASRAGFAFDPPTYATQLQSDETVNFNAARLSYTIDGHITDAGGASLAGVTVALSGAQSASTQTDAAGNYSFAGLPSEGSYTVTPSYTNYSFAPTAQSYTNLLSGQTANFNGTRITYALSGRVTDGAGNALGGVAVALGGAQSATMQTDAAGNYSFPGLTPGVSYTVTPSKNHYTFSPPVQSFDNLSANSTANFSATLLRHNINGRIADASSNALAGVNVSLVGTQSLSTVTDASGNYSFNSLPAGGDYTVQPSKQFYSFSPVRQIYNDLSANQTANFTSALLRFSISGRITEGGTGVGGLGVALSGSQSAVTQTDAAGNYTFNSLPADGSYTVTPDATYFSYTPASASFNTLPFNQTANFAATRRTFQVSGYTLDACGRAIPSVSMSLTHDGITVNAVSDANGFYSFASAQGGYSYTLTPSKAAYFFTPNSVSLPALSANAAANFSGRPANASVDVLPLADSYVTGGNSNTNFGTSTQLITRLANNASNTFETYLKFDLGQQCTVSNVRLRLYGKLSSGSTLAVMAYSLSDVLWTEAGLTWNNKPLAGTLLNITNVTTTTATWYEWDVTSYVRNEINAGRRTVAFVLKNQSSSNTQTTFNSRQSTTNQPRLVVSTP